ncbi:MAG: alpha/beta hydrolase, partial [Halomonadaceae bacterium]
GSADFLAGPNSNQRPVFERTNVPVFWANSQGTSHFAPIGNFGVYRGMSTAWWEFQLKGDSDAADLFTGPCLGCDINGWVIQTRGL